MNLRIGITWSFIHALPLWFHEGKIVSIFDWFHFVVLAVWDTRYMPTWLGLVSSLSLVYSWRVRDVSQELLGLWHLSSLQLVASITSFLPSTRLVPHLKIFRIRGPILEQALLCYRSLANAHALLGALAIWLFTLKQLHTAFLRYMHLIMVIFNISLFYWISICLKLLNLIFNSKFNLKFVLMSVYLINLITCNR